MEMNDRTPRHSEMLIKVCGNCIADNIADVASLTPMLMGFIFYEPSPRSAIGLDPKVVSTLPPFIRPVAVFVNETEKTISDTATRYGIKIVQLHGNESPELCKSLKAKGFVVFKAIGVSDDTDWSEIKKYSDSGVDLFVLDTATPTYGGSGKKFNWNRLESYHLPTPYLLSGGIGPDDVDNIVDAMRPGMAGIDINSRFESSPGVKDISTLTHFILSLRNFNENESPTTPFWEQNE